MGAKKYEPTEAHHSAAIGLISRHRRQRVLRKLVWTAAFYLVLLAWRSDFDFPPRFHLADIFMAMAIFAGSEIWWFFDKTGAAKAKLFTQELDQKKLGPMRYRVDLNRLEWWWQEHHDNEDWESVDRYRLTDDLLIVAHSRRGGYWALPRSDIGPDLVSDLIEKFEQIGLECMPESGKLPLAQHST
ncbi:hypothetical protein GRI89_08620 [Altererythrobacter salegens]|uniref:YcxB-like protein domain-containing protein n=1 Tax=Croceibacterium salegens TaxID=1737568 RepID=A0A6I4SUR1_9SPHN|nr:hypothetical protein [Croceibacterium salegens]MXO59603.1 hypothetical protein [Croceibacterium salegens]